MSPHIVFVAASGTVPSTAADLADRAHAVYETPLLSVAARTELSRVMVPAQQYALGGRVRQLELGGRAQLRGRLAQVRVINPCSPTCPGKEGR